MTLYGAVGIDVAMLPIGGNFNTGSTDAVKAVGFLQPQMAILMHYSTLGVITQDAQPVADAIRAAAWAQPVIMQPGETLIV